ncbi:hypothetical protein V3C99_007612, partial [Haemonchus contortus]
IGVADVMSVFTSCFHRLNRDLRLSPDYQHIVILASILSGLAFVAHMIGNVIITINRYSTLCLLQKYGKYWKRRNVWILIAIQCTIASVSFLQTFGAKLVYDQYADGTFFYVGLEKGFNLANRSIYVAVCMIYAIVSINLNVRLLLEWHRLSQAGNLSRHSRQEKGLVLYAVSVFLFSTLMCAQQLTKGFAVFTDNKSLNMWATLHFYWINDVMVTIPPLSLLLLSSELRREIINFCKCTR